MKCLITGAGGFIGSHLCEFLLAQQQFVVAAARRRYDFPIPACCNLEIAGGDLTNSNFANHLLEHHKPDVVFHLAAESLPQVAWQKPAETFYNNLTGSLNLFEAAMSQGSAPLIIAASSSSLYASGSANSRLNEESTLKPDSIYAVGKMAMEQMAGIYHEAMGLNIIIVRPFFIIGPRKKGDVSSDFARGIVRIERGKANELPVGNLTNIRDFMDVQDFVSALWRIALRGKAGSVYNICSGRGHSIGDLLAVFTKNTKVIVRTKSDSKKMRRIDDAAKIGDPAKLVKLGWKPQFDLEQSARAILDYWRKEDARGNT